MTSSHRDDSPRRGVRVLFTEAEISRRVTGLASEISRDTWAGESPVMISMLRGGLIFAADLARCLPAAHVEFLSISSFEAGSESGGRVRIEKDLETDIAGRQVLVVEDVVDTGLTLSYLLGTLAARRPATLEVVALLDKRARRIIDTPIKYAGFEIGDEFVLGYGLDYAQLYRNVPFIFAPEDLDALVTDPAICMERALELARGGEDAQREAR